MTIDQFFEKYKKFIPLDTAAECYADLVVMFRENCSDCMGSGVETDENGVQADGPCIACGGIGIIS